MKEYDLDFTIDVQALNKAVSTLRGFSSRNLRDVQACALIRANKEDQHVTLIASGTGCQMQIKLAAIVAQEGEGLIYLHKIVIDDRAENVSIKIAKQKAYISFKASQRPTSRHEHQIPAVAQFCTLDEDSGEPDTVITVESDEDSHD